MKRDLDIEEPPDLDEADEVPPFEAADDPVAPFAWNEPRDLALLRIALAGGQSAAEIAEKLAGRPEFGGAWIDPAEVAKRVSLLRATVAPKGLTVPRLLADRYRPNAERLVEALRAVDRTGEV